MKKYQSIGLSIILLVSLMGGTLLWLRAFGTSLSQYRSPLRDVTLSPQTPTLPAYTHKVVVVLISGLGYDNALALNLPVFSRLSQTGATAAVQSSPPTFPQTAWATLLSGAPAETNDAPPIDLVTQELYPLEIDTLFNRAKAANLQTAVFGQADWGQMIPDDLIDHKFVIDTQGFQTDELILESALPIIKDDQTELIVLQFTQLNVTANQQAGIDNQAYLEAANQVDAYLETISTALDLSNAVLIVTADHGHTEDGGYGGDEVEVIWQPFVMNGQDIIPGVYSDIHQTDVAPTIATLLGLAPPTATQGRILLEMLRLSETEQAILQLGLTKQRIALAGAYITQMGDSQTTDLTTLIEDLEYAETTFNNNNINGALQLASLARGEADAKIAAVRNGHLQTSRLIRLPIVLTIVGLWLLMLWRKRGVHTGSIIIAAGFTLILYHTLYQLQGYSYSISSYINIISLPLEIARRTTVSLLIGWGILLILLMLADEGNWARLLGSAYGYSVLVTFMFTAPFFWGYWQNGWAVTTYLPSVVPAFWQIAAAIEGLVAATLGLLLPWAIMILCLFVHLVRHRLNETGPSHTKTGSLPGLHL